MTINTICDLLESTEVRCEVASSVLKTKDREPEKRVCAVEHLLALLALPPAEGKCAAQLRTSSCWVLVHWKAKVVVAGAESSRCAASGAPPATAGTKQRVKQSPVPLRWLTAFSRQPHVWAAFIDRPSTVRTLKKAAASTSSCPLTAVAAPDHHQSTCHSLRTWSMNTRCTSRRYDAPAASQGHSKHTSASFCTAAVLDTVLLLSCSVPAVAEAPLGNLNCHLQTAVCIVLPMAVCWMHCAPAAQQRPSQAVCAAAVLWRSHSSSGCAQQHY